MQEGIPSDTEALLLEYRAILEYAGLAILFTRNRRIYRCNQRAAEVFCWDDANSLQGHIGRVLFSSDENYTELNRHARKILGNGEILSTEINFARKDGVEFPAHVIARAIDANNPRAGTIWIIEDITEKRQEAQENERLQREHQTVLEQRVEERTTALSSQIHFLHQLIETIPGPLFYKDKECRYVGCNSAFTKILGRTHEAILGKTAYDITPSDLALQHEQTDRALLLSSGSQFYESQIENTDGTRRDVMIHKASFTRPDGSIDGLVGVMLDITERKQMETRLKLSATVFDSTADGVTITTTDGSIIAVNRAFSEITGYKEEEVIGKNPRFLQSGLQDKAFYTRMWQAVLHLGRWRGEIWNKRKDGSIFPELLTISTVRNEAGLIEHLVGVFSDITALKDSQEALDFQAHHDSLTSLPNRLLLEDRISKAIQRALRHKQQLALLFIDLDRFKNINDTLGHHVGDIVLCETARRFVDIVRESDSVARLGGDEFVILLENIATQKAIALIADKILDDLHRPIPIDGQEFFIGASIGISCFPQDGEDYPTLLKHADVAMYRAKERGRNTYEFFAHEPDAFSLDNLRLEADIRYALDRDELLVYFQPQFSLKNGRLTGAEALVRWRHPGRGMVSPGQFIPLAEESGLIVPMGEWILRHACTYWAEWHHAGLAPGTLAVNVSGIEFRRGRVRESVEATLAATHLPPQNLELEITESAIMNQADSSIKALHSLRDIGVQLAIDDFGTGYSSLSYLKRLPLNKLKVDQSFVRGLPNDTDDAAITRAIIALAHSLQLTTIAEGVETEEQRQFLISAGCDEMQGFLLGRPIPASDFLALLKARPSQN